jgi:hypothetical protein
VSDGLHCGNCGAPVHVPPGVAPGASFACPFCGAEVERPASSNVQAQVVVLQGADALEQLDSNQLARVQQALNLAEQQIGAIHAKGGAPFQQWVSGQVPNVPLPADEDPALEPPARRSSGIKGIVIGVLAALLLGLAAYALFGFFDWLQQ